MSLLRHAVSRSGSNALRLRPQCVAGPSRSPLLSIVSTRTYASKHKKGKNDKNDKNDKPPPTPANTGRGVGSDALVPGSQRIVGGEAYRKAEAGMKASLDWLRKEITSLETRASGRVTTGLLAPVRVKVPHNAGPDGRGVRLEEIATVGVREGTTLMITVFEEPNLKLVEQALYEAKLPGLMPQRVDNRSLKIPVPKPTVDARQALYATALKNAEESRVQIRKLHSTALKKGEVKKFTPEFDELQALQEKHMKEVDKMLADMKKTTGAK